MKKFNDDMGYDEFMKAANDNGLEVIETSRLTLQWHVVEPVSNSLQFPVYIHTLELDGGVYFVEARYDVVYDDMGAVKKELGV